ncbi:RHS repeat-associated core domain-containing protein [Lysobacter sp. M15]|uniref:RHS repeat domain-containing protein n=1 Tax=Lysobacter sp. M15 TaxID=2916837 RepID=UPI001F59266A|nr:RHS repeat-associated core domain-containing protein [Lysobacter sp. M15]
MNGLRSTKTARFFQRRAWPVIALLACLLPLGAQAQTVTYEKTEQIVYENNKTAWVIGQVKSVTCLTSIPSSTQSCNGHVVSETSYDAATALPLQTKAFGKIQQTLTYNLTTGTQDGTLSTVKDGNNNITTLSNWMRGIPQTITHPATTDQPTPVTESAVVNNDGTIASVTDETQSKTCYGYDAMGRINLITYPSETANVCDTSKWAATTISFNDGYPAVYGIPAGHWRQLVQTGNGRKTVLFDALWRPIVEQTIDMGNIANTRSDVVKRYDAGGRLIFQSYPTSTLANWTDTTLSGTDYTYDALDRPLTAVQDSELGLLTTTTEYLTGFQTRVTNPRLYQTVIQYQAYDQPSTDAPVGITRYAGVDTSATEIARDPHGKPLTIKRRNAGNTLSATRSYAYHASQELCAAVEPETGATLMGYDGAGNLAWSASGLPAATACDLEGDTTAILARKITRAYDARNRMVHVYHPDGRGNVAYTYTPDGLPAQVGTNNDNTGAQMATTTYAYNRRRLLESETLQYASVLSWPVDYVYNTNGHLSAQVWHGLNVSYAPDALGRPTQAGTFASGVSYYPNGAIKQFTYGNGIIHQLTQNVRGLPRRSLDIYGSTHQLDDTYDYDPNGNVLAISDGRDAAQRRNVDMVYDGLDRLTSAISPMFGTATYAYDVLDNLTRTNVTGGNGVRDRYYCYNSQWQLAFVRSGSVCTGATPSPAVTALEYDVQGNVSDKNAQTFAFDYGNRLRSVNTPASTYAYDGLGRRVWDRTTDDKYSHYLQNGQLSMTGDERAKEVAEYIYLQGSLIAIRERNTVTNVYTTKYQHTDALGSPVAVTDASRAVIAAETNEFEPYGRVANRALTDGPNYTGHVADAATGLVYAQQRYYDPGIGRFLSVDPVVVRVIGDNFNRYWYANNNPYKFTDPDGRETGMFQFGENRMQVSSYEGVGTVAGALPGIGTAMAIGEAIQNPTLGNIASAGASVLGPIGNAASKMIRALDKGADIAKAARAEARAEAVVRKLPELPSLDSTGKVHGALPNVRDLGRYDASDLKSLKGDLEKSVQKRIEVTVQKGSDYGHSARQAAEQQLIKRIDKHLQDR